MPPEFGDLWSAVSAFHGPILLLRGMSEGSVVSDADEAELLRLAPTACVERVVGAGHSIQGDQPLLLAHLVGDFVS